MKTILEHVLSWPVIVFILVLMFRKPLHNLINRIDLVKGAGIEVSTPHDHAAQQLKNEETPNSSELVLPAQEQLTLSLPEDIEQRRRSVLAYGGDDEMLLLQMRAVKETLQDLYFPLNSEETTHLLIRHLAVTQLLMRADQLYRLIYGSQIALMHELNESGPQPELVIRRIYERAKAESPTFYCDYEFENWIKFLMTQQAIWYENGRYVITVFGRNFLSWLVVTAAASKLY